jgi:hypothetical protein
MHSLVWISHTFISCKHWFTVFTIILKNQSRLHMLLPMHLLIVKGLQNTQWKFILPQISPKHSHTLFFTLSFTFCNLPSSQLTCWMHKYFYDQLYVIFMTIHKWLEQIIKSSSWHKLTLLTIRLISNCLFEHQFSELCRRFEVDVISQFYICYVKLKCNSCKNYCVGLTGDLSWTNHNLSTRKTSVVVYGKLIHARDTTQSHTHTILTGILLEAVKNTPSRTPRIFSGTLLWMSAKEKHRPNTHTSTKKHTLTQSRDPTSGRKEGA